MKRLRILNSAKREGMEEGQVEEKREIAKKALAEGASIEFISEITGLTKERINEL